MAVIVRYTQTGADYVFLGTGFGAYMSERPSAFLGSFAPTEESGTMPMVAVCDYDGQIGWIPSAHVEVMSIDGRTPEEILDVVEESEPEAEPS